MEKESKKKPIKFERREYSLDTIIENYNNGIFKIPRYQRGYVWDADQRSLLVDSILNNYPIGTILI